MFVHLHTHSYYSFLNGLASPQALAQAAAQQGMPALALTDLNMLTGAVEFQDACQSAGVLPILGLELLVAPPSEMHGISSGSLVLLAMDLAGWASLCLLSSLANQGVDPIPFDRLAAESAQLICLSGGKSGLAARLLRQDQARQALRWLGGLAGLFTDRLYVELQRHTAEDCSCATQLAELAKRQGLPLVATHNIHYLHPEQAHLQRVLAAICRNRPLEGLPAEASAPPGSFFTSQDEMAERFKDLPQALDAALEISSRCRLTLPVGKPQFPEVRLSSGQSALAVLRQKAEAGAQRIYGTITSEIQSRLEHELDVIGETGYTALFLIMEEILAYARQSGVPTSSRGSASSSLVAHCLGITSPDPIRLNLYFERFLNPARATPPDIDTDLCSRRRDGVIRFVYERFGQDRVAMVCTISRFRKRSALREVAKAYGLPPGQVSTLAEALPYRWYGPPDRFAKEESPYAELEGRYTSSIHQAIFRDAAALIGIPDHLSVHPGGVVIAPGKLTDLSPTQLAAKGVLITQFDLDSIERLGLVKIDLLGIRGLSVLGDVAEEIYKNLSIQTTIDAGQKTTDDQRSVDDLRYVYKYSNMLDVLEAIPQNDPDTSEAVRHGRTIGCFQIESPGMRTTLKEIQARSVDDLMVALALYRPGPLTGGLKDAFVRRHLGQESTTQLHPALASLLADTYGVILYQEQVLRIAHDLAGLNLADADLLRRAMSHFDPGKQMQVLKEKFIAGALARSGVPPETGERVWELMAAFAGYGFPKAHAASYAQVAWRAAWCKSHHPAIFMAAVLANWGGYYSQRVYLTEARRTGLAVRPPQVNYASQQFSVQYLDKQPVLFMGLDQVRDLTRHTQLKILRERPYYSLMDFLAKVDPRPAEAENLARAGALEGFGAIPVLLRQIASASWRGGQLPLFAETFTDGEEWSLAEKVAAQEAVLGVGVVAHPLELVAEEIMASGALTTVEAASQIGKRVRVAGMRQTWRRSLTARGDYIYFMSLEDLEGMLDVVIVSEVYRHNRAALSSPGPYIIEGIVELDKGEVEPSIRAEKVEPVRQAAI